ncbi:MAG TPA: DNA-directed RNA polymerase [Candidatus Woesearchaeota archaeon]|nr:DNA-directed RNA polymerase [Candidatus Woesearchaeota archaeon]
MYTVLDLKSNIRVPPSLFGKELKESIASAIKEKFIGHLGDEGLFLALIDVNKVGDGTIISGDGAVYYETDFKMLAYRPILQEVVEGVVSEITEFGVFVRIGPIDGLVHVSQVMDDYVNYSDVGVLSGKESNRTLKVKDKVRAKIIAISMKSVKGAKLGLTMRQPGLGKLEWIDAEKKDDEVHVEKEKKASSKTKKK